MVVQLVDKKINNMIIVIAITLHFIFDWIIQPRDIAKTKKISAESFSYHMVYNILPLHIVLLGVLYMFEYPFVITSVAMIISFFSHGVIDWFLPSGKNEREMINWTAVDQILHLGILISVINYIS